MKNTILITGASRGLGYCLTNKYLKDGDVVFAGVRDMTDPNIIKLKKEYPDTLIPVELDVSETNSVNRAVNSISNYTDKLDILINNAAIHNSSSFEILEKADIDDCMDVYNVNCLGAIRVVKAFIHFIRKSISAKIINISSESGSITECKREKEYDYCMSKAALNMGTKILANYLKKDNIIVLAVHPGWMRTDMGGSNARFDPYETACRLIELFKDRNDHDQPIFIDYEGNEYPW
ncbi:SDR family oxidoreductase [Mobilitalea sibirica]|uniref:SDR family oxidoreductase n=1 Tax=Mobilitalea sibirica TaxID=1462919 RepID=A0A8J7HBS0_9FIRM|nr:SDR family oxidoreductase [Mobilitalea sibirica]MBH1940297.1 SDR family oxidoreductase [Mobilitalea sibirica]